MMSENLVSLTKAVKTVVFRLQRWCFFFFFLKNGKKSGKFFGG